MNKKTFKCFCFIFAIFLLLFLTKFMPVFASEIEYDYSYIYNEITYYSNESEDDAWYQAMVDNFDKGLITEEQIEEEYIQFSRRNLTSVVDTYDNQSDLTGEPVTYVNGYLSWKTSTNYVLPLKNIRVDLYNKNVIGAELLATTYTNLDGYYCFEFINDTSWYENGGYDIFIRCYPDSYTFEIARDWAFSFLTYYYYQSNTIFDVDSGTTTDFNAQLAYCESNMANNAFYLSQGLVTAQRFAMEMGMRTNKFLHVIYPFSDGDVAFCYDEYSGIASHKFANFDTVMHEYGHFVEGVLGNYGSDLMDIILYNPNHELKSDHFYDKSNKLFAMNLTWSEAWATTFAQIAQHKYMDEYYGKILGYGDLIISDTNYETYSPTKDSCEAQEIAVIASLWDIFDGGTNENFDSLSLTYSKWWEITTRDNIQTLSDFFNVVNTYYPEYRSKIGEIFSAHQISPSNFTISNLNSISKDTPPIFSWTVNGSLQNPNNQFRLVFYNLSGDFLYQTDLLSSNLSYNQTYTYNMTQAEWNLIISDFINVVDLNIVVQGFNSFSPLSGPYNSQYFSLTMVLENHVCDYYHHFLSYNRSSHKSFCACGEYVLRPHVVSSTASGRYKPCVDCGYLVDTRGDIVIVEPHLVNKYENYDNCIIILNDDKIYAYLINRTIIYYSKDSKEEINEKV